MQISSFVLVFILFVAFTIGLNLGLHGNFVLSDVHTPSVIKNIYAQSGNDRAKLAPSPAATASSIASKGKTSQLSATITTTLSTTSMESREIAATKTLPTAIEAKRSAPANSNILDEKILDIEAKVDEFVRSHDNADKREDVLSAFVSGGQKFPIVLLTCNRDAQLKETLASLLSVRGVEKQQILVSQDGAMEAVSKVVHDAEITLIQNTGGLRLRGGAHMDGAARIATHYQYSLSAAFDRNPSAPAIIIVEDDLLFAPDFYEYFTSVAPVLDTDPSAFIVSAWSDNGFKGKVQDPYALRRTEYFPGLGWLLTRKLYKGELEAKWPREHWDHWLRSPSVNKNREIVFPQVPRTYHNGIKGTFMNLDTHNRYFRDIAYNTNPVVSWGSGGGSSVSATTALMKHYGHSTHPYIKAQKETYEYRVEELIKGCIHVNRVEELAAMQNKVLCLWIDVDPNSERNPPPFEPAASFFGLWHEHRRGAHKGLHEFYWYSNYVLLLNTHDTQLGHYKSLMPPTARHLDPRSFLEHKDIVMSLALKAFNIEPVNAKQTDKSCDEVCSSQGKSCHEDYLKYINSCELLKEVYGCNECTVSYGAEQPAYVSPNAASQFHPGTCLVNKKPESSTCAAKHPATIRLCTCQ